MPPVDIGNVPPSSLQTVSNPAPTTLSSGNVVDIVLQDAATNTPSTVLKIEHGTSGTPVAAATAAAAFGTKVEFKLDDTVNVKQIAAVLGAHWRAVGAIVGSDSGVLSVTVQSSGSLVQVAAFNDYASQFQNGNTTNPGIGFISDARHGMCQDGSSRVGIVHTSVQVAAFDSTAGTPRIGVLANVGAPVAAQAVGATPTNNVALTGSANVFPDFTNGTTYATDYASLHATISQMAAKITAIDAALKLFGWLKV